MGGGALGTKIDGVVPPGLADLDPERTKHTIKDLEIVYPEGTYYEVEKHTRENTDKKNWQKSIP